MNKISDSDAPQAAFPAVLRVMPAVAAGFATAVSILALIGWLTATELLKRVLPGLIAMNPVTAVTFIVAAAALTLLREPVRSPAYLLIAVLDGVSQSGVFNVSTAKFPGLLKEAAQIRTTVDEFDLALSAT